MEWSDKTVAVTGGARGIGAAIATACAARGARIAIADRAGAEEAASNNTWFGATVDVGDEADMARFISLVERNIGPIDVFVSNAGVGVTDAPGWQAASAPNAGWDLCWRVNVMANVFAARHVVPGMLARGGGVFLVTASAAGLLSSIGDAAYSATKHAAVAFAESLAITHGDDGLAVHCLCPEGVRTDLVKGVEGGAHGLSGYLEPGDVANKTLDAIDERRFLITTHEHTADYARRRMTDHGRWLDGMREIRRALIEKMGRPM